MWSITYSTMVPIPAVHSRITQTNQKAGHQTGLFFRSVKDRWYSVLLIVFRATMIVGMTFAMFMIMTMPMIVGMTDIRLIQSDTYGSAYYRMLI